MIELRDGSQVVDPRLGRIAELDERSRGFRALAVLPASQQVVKGKSWLLPKAFRLNQSISRGIPNYDEGGCTGYSRTYDLAAQPAAVKLGANADMWRQFAHALYRLGQHYDEWPGEGYSGSSVLGVLKACAALGFVGEYRWAFGIDDACVSLAQLGTITVGTDWLNNMFDPRPNGVIEVDKNSGIAGGHAYSFRSIIVSRDYIRRLIGKGEHIREGVPLLRGVNSWWEPGEQMWGLNGEFLMWADDLEVLLKGVDSPGECSVITKAFKK